ncbi:MAG: DUF748 domain-containing protein [Candidatus Omnitrophota bacterium]
MKLVLKILIAVLIILALLYSAAYIFVAVKGQALLVKKLEGAFKKEVNIGCVGLKLPLSLKIKDLNIDELANIDYVIIFPSLLGLIKGEFIFNKVNLINPEISWERRLPADEAGKEDGVNIAKALDQTKEALNSSVLKIEDKLPPQVIIRYLSVRGGILKFTDRTAPDPGVEITVKEISLNLTNLYLFPESVMTNFQVNAKIPWKEGIQEGRVAASGWLDLYKKDIQATLELEGIDGVSLYPYYYKWVDLENARIEEASLNFISNIQGENNDVLAQCQLELTDIKFRPRPPDQPEHKAEKITTAVLGIFRAIHQGRVLLNFTIRTKMDKPEFKFESISSAVDAAIYQGRSGRTVMEDVSKLPVKFVGEVTKGAAGFVEGAISVGKSIADAILGAFKSSQEQGEDAEPEQQDFKRR